MKQPTRRAGLIAGIGCLLVLAGATAQAGWLFVLAAGVLAIVAGSFVAGHPSRALKIVRSLPGRVRVGDEVRVGLTVRNDGRRWVPVALLEDRFAAFEPIRVAHDPIPPGTQSHLELVRQATRRGSFASGHVAWDCAAPFGLARSRSLFLVDSATKVVPRWVELTTFPILEPASSPSDVVHERARTGAGEEYLGVREYRPGDPPKTVHWRSTARAGHLIVREYEQEASVRVGLVLAGGDHGAAPDSSYEALVSAFASVGLYSLTTGHPIDAVRATDAEPEYLASPNRTELLDWLAAAAPLDTSLAEAVKTILPRIGRHGTVVLFSPDAGAAGDSVAEAARAVQMVGARAIAVLARSSTWSDTAGTEVTGSFERVPVRWVGRGEDLATCLQG
ncbi:MAG: DUF58 domain-containing protein [Actinomycetota bacterium]|nr:DUF58 domain-containing protein [Actinomycetota bacterium]